VPIAQIVGSMDRFNDFDRTFLPRQGHTAKRWKSVDRAFYQDVPLPAIQLYKVGDIYFVKDGNHRVSVARERGAEYIDAEVIEGHIRVPLYASMSATEMLLQVEYAEFLRRTAIDRSARSTTSAPPPSAVTTRSGSTSSGTRSGSRRSGTAPRQPMRRSGTGTTTSTSRSCGRRGSARVLERLPHRTEADVYLWTMRHRGELEQRYGRDIGPVASAEDYAEIVAQHSGPIGRLRTAADTIGGWLSHLVPTDRTPGPARARAEGRDVPDLPDGRDGRVGPPDRVPKRDGADTRAPGG
jgi:hypothetical protein